MAVFGILRLQVNPLLFSHLALPLGIGQAVKMALEESRCKIPYTRLKSLAAARDAALRLKSEPSKHPLSLDNHHNVPASLARLLYFLNLINQLHTTQPPICHKQRTPPRFRSGVQLKPFAGL